MDALVEQKSKMADIFKMEFFYYGVILYRKKYNFELALTIPTKITI
jgi:hypothetical protein